MCILKIDVLNSYNNNNILELGKRKDKFFENDLPISKSSKINIDHILPSNSIENKNTCINKQKKKLKGCLIDAAQKGNLKRIKYVLENDLYDVDINESHMGCTPLHYACFYNHYNVVEYLIECGASLDVKNTSGRTPVYWAVEQKAYNIVGYLLECEADPSICDNKNNSPLIKAVQMQDYKMVEVLLSINTETEEWTKLNTKNNEGFTALSFACHQGNLDIVKLLVEYGANVDIYSNENKISPLHRAVSRNHIKIVRYLLDNGANINHIDLLGRTPLHIAVLYNHENIIKLLLYNHPSIICDSNGNTPLDIAQEKQNKVLVDLISTYQLSL